MPSRNGGAGQVEHLQKTADPGCHAATETKKTSVFDQKRASGLEGVRGGICGAIIAIVLSKTGD